MGRRCRHISWRAIGAAQAFDARQITGVSDGSTVQTWTDLGTGGNNASQSDSGRRPVYRTGANGLNNGPVLQFDGSNDHLPHSFSENASSATNIVLAFATASQTSYRSFYMTLPAGQNIRIGVNSTHDGNPSNKLTFSGWNYMGGAPFLSDSSFTPSVIISTYEANTYNVSINGSWKASSSSTATYNDQFDRRNVGAEAITAQWVEPAACKIAICCTIQPTPSRAMLNRISHSISRSYKLASS